jgi:type VI secretion system secreted protein VgrG
MGELEQDEDLKQDKRVGSFNTPLGKDVLVLVRFDATEGLSELFEFRIEALSNKPDINFDDAIGKQCTLKFKTYGPNSESSGIGQESEPSGIGQGSSGSEREFSGIMVEAQWLGVGQRLYSYRLVLRPWLWLLSHSSDCRIFQDKKAHEIIEQVFKDRGFSDYEFRLEHTGDYPKLEYCVQYRETDLNFVSRLMEQHGIYYFFEHKGEKHKLILVDSKSKHEPVPGHTETTYNANVGNWTRQEERIYEWISERQFRTGKIEFNDYNYLKSTSKLTSDQSASEHYAHSDMEVYDYPGKYKEKSEGDFYSKIRLESEQTPDHRRYANGDAISLFPGGLTTLTEHPADSQNKKYLIVRSTHTFIAQSYRSGAQATSGADADYYGTFQFMQSDKQFRAPLITPKPLIHGIQTAVVVTKDSSSNEEIEVEELTEIYVRFYWMREQGDKQGKQRSCKLRVAQVWSGKKWGGQFIPRVGQEVVVEFLEGDPDRPLVVGAVYNDQYKPPYDLPSKKTIAGIKSDSTKGSGGYNELKFEDKKGSEDIVMHAEKDHDVVIKDTQTVTIGESFTSHKGPAARDWTLKQGDDNLEVTAGNQKVRIAKTQQIDVDNDITITSFTKITLKVGSNQVVIDMTGVHIQGMKIDLQANAMITQQAPMIKIN